MRLDAAYRPAPAVVRALVSLMTAALFLIGVPAPQGSLLGQEPSGRFRVLVVPLQSGPLKDRFGEDVAEMIRDRLDDLATHAPVEKRDFEQALRRYDVKREDLNPIRARQLANLIGAQVVFFGSVEGGAGQSGHTVSASFIEVQSGDEVGIPEVTVTRDNKDEARKVADAAMQAFEEQVRFLRARQFCADYVGSQQPENALRNCNEALAINATSVPALFNKGLAFRQLFERAIGGDGIQPEDTAEDMSADVEALRAQTDSLLEAADGDDGDLSLDAEAREWGDSAVALFERVLEQRPGHREAMQNAAYVYTRLGEAERASELYSQYLELDPANVPVRLKVAYDLAQGGLMKEAVDVIEEGLDHDSANVDLLQFLGDYALRYSSEDSTYLPVALKAYEQVLDLKGEETDLQLLENVMATYTRSGRSEEAIDFAQRALSVHPDSPRLWSLYADALARAERYSDATGAMDSVLAIDQSYPNGYLKRGMFRLEAGDRESAMSDFQQAIDLGTSSQEDVFRVFWAQAHGARDQGNLADAVQLFEVAARYAGNQAQEVQFWWAYTYYQLGERLAEPEDAAVNRLQQAQRYFQQAQAHFEEAGNVRPEVPQLKDATGKWLQNVEARIRRAQRAGS